MDALVGAMGNLCPVRNAAPTSWRVLRHFGDVDDVVGEPTSRVRTVALIPRSAPAYQMCGHRQDPHFRRGWKNRI